MSVKSVCAVVCRPPVGNRDSWEIMRFSLGLLAGDLDYRLVFAGDGVYHVLEDLPPKTPEGRDSVQRLLEDSLDFDVEVYAVEEDLAARGLQPRDVAARVEVIPARRVAELIRQADATYFI